MTSAPADAGALQTPALARRLACFVYEALILFGVGLVSGAIGAVLVAAAGPQHAQRLALPLQIVGFCVYAAYFTWFWSTSGQTLPMQTWRIRVVTADGRPLGKGRALLRYVASYVWIAPAMLLAGLNGWSRWQTLGAVAAGIAAYAALTRLHPDRQYWHDAVCGTRLVDWTPPPKP